MFQMQTRCTISTDATQANLEQSTLPKQNWQLHKNSKQDYQIQIRLSRIYPIQIHHKFENPSDLNPNPHSSILWQCCADIKI